MSSAIMTVCRKEVLDNARDRRTLFSTMVFGPLFGPALFAVLVNVMLSQTLSSIDRAVQVPVVGGDTAPNLMAYLERHSIERIDGPEDLAAAEAAVRSGQHEVVVVIDEGFREQFREGGDARVTLVSDRSEIRASAAAARVRAVLNAYAEELRLLRLQARGISPLILRPLTIDEFDVSTATGRSVALLGMLTYFLLLATLMGGFYLAIDTTAGERERGSLEPLLTAPVARSSLLAGKMIATICYMLLSLALTLAAFTVALAFVPLESLGMSSNFGPFVAFQVFLILAPFTPLGAALMTLVASFTKSYKEAQTYLALVLLVPTLPLMVATLTNVRPSLNLMWIPSLSHHLLVTDLIKAEPVNLGYLAASEGSTLLLGAALAWLATRLYDREALLG